jgi:L-alanine-DL-glutamate epimerase-like enolase superfamily enzyme
LPGADSLLVKVTTDRGLEGWGGGFRAVRSAKLAIEELIAPLCIGKNPFRGDDAYPRSLSFVLAFTVARRHHFEFAD